MNRLPAFAAACLLTFSLTAQHASKPAPMHKPTYPASKQLIVNFHGKLTTFTVAQLLKMPQVTVHVHNVHHNADETYTGPLVSEVLAAAGLRANDQTDPMILHSSVVATAADHYFVVYSAAELEPDFSRSQVIVALMKSGLPDTDGGVLQLINTDANKPARWVHGLTDLNVITIATKR
jgi:hypothetical protein